MEPSSVSSDTKPASATRDLNSLCETCCTAFAAAALGESSQTHHKSLQSLKDAARSGCHVCSLIELYCRGAQIDPRLPLRLKFNLRERRSYVLGLKVEKDYLKIKLGLKSYHHALPLQQASGHYNPDSEVPDEVFSMIQDWLQQCSAQHPQCQDIQTTRMPTRLIGVGSCDSPSVRLLRTEAIQAPYLTLSHCWGSADIEKRTIDGDFDVLLDLLPRTFQDAVLVTRKLGFAYLWIDSLCIIQGDKADWERESVNMAHVYANGTLNLAASCSINSHGGLILDRNHLQVTPFCWEHNCTSVVSHRFDGRWMESDKVRWIFDPQSEFGWLGNGTALPLTSRGWVLQENALSPRTLHFLPGEIVWECRCVVARESCYRPCPQPELRNEFRGQVPRSHIPIVQTRLKTLLRFPHDIQSGGNEGDVLRATDSIDAGYKDLSQLYQQWYKIITQYSQKSLTKSEDRLPAIWALAERFQIMTNDEYCSGIWRRDILNGLLFKRIHLRSSEFQVHHGSNAPSWSWAATESEVTFEPVHGSSPSRLPDAQIQSILLVPLTSHSESMGRTSRSELVIRTHMSEITGDHIPKRPSPEELAAQALGLTGYLGIDASRLYGDLEWEYEQIDPISDYTFPRITNPFALSPKDQWIRDQAHRRYGPDLCRSSLSLSTVSSCFPTGTQHQERALWRQEQKKIENSGMDKVLRHQDLDLHFDTRSLAYRYARKPVCCLHIKGTSGLLVELDETLQKYRRIGVFTHVNREGYHDFSSWEEKTVTLI